MSSGGLRKVTATGAATGAAAAATTAAAAAATTTTLTVVQSTLVASRLFFGSVVAFFVGLKQTTAAHRQRTLTRSLAGDIVRERVLEVFHPREISTAFFLFFLRTANLTFP